MKNIVAFFVLLFGVNYSNAQDLYLVKLKQKENTEIYLSNPLQMLTQKALDRRLKYSIALDEKDIPISTQRIKAIKQLNLNYVGKTKWLNTIMVEISDETTLQNLRNLNFVESVTSMVRNNQAKITQPSKIKWTDFSKTNTSYNYGYSDDFIKQINVHPLHKKNILGQAVSIAVIDAGFPLVNMRPAFEVLRNENRIVDMFDFVENKQDVYEDNRHGTMVLSTMAAEINGQYIGIAPKANYALYRSEDASIETPKELLYWIQAAERADSIGIDVINTSLGYNTFDDTRYDYTFDEMDGKTTLISQGANIATEKGIFVVVSAGNEGNNHWKRITAPADSKNVFSVGANKITQEAAAFSSYGPNALGEIKPNVSALGQDIYVLDPNDGFGQYSGTSFSGPVTAGAVALMIQQFPTMAHHVLKDKIQQTGHLFASPSQQLGYGIPDYTKASEMVLAVTDLNDKLWTKIYPNPFLNEIFIQSQGKVKLVEVYNLVGEKLISSSNQTSIKTEKLKSGVYLIQIKFVDGKTFTQKIIKK